MRGREGVAMRKKSGRKRIYCGGQLIHVAVRLPREARRFLERRAGKKQSTISGELRELVFAAMKMAGAPAPAETAAGQGDAPRAGLMLVEER